jgi:hypothetical protein
MVKTLSSSLSSIIRKASRHGVIAMETASPLKEPYREKI